MVERLKKTGGPHLLVAIRDFDIRSDVMRGDVDGMGQMCRENSSPATPNGCREATATP
jgi:hypothetical protein